MIQNNIEGKTGPLAVYSEVPIIFIDERGTLIAGVCKNISYTTMDILLGDNNGDYYVECMSRKGWTIISVNRILGTTTFLNGFSI